MQISFATSLNLCFFGGGNMRIQVWTCPYLCWEKLTVVHASRPFSSYEAVSVIPNYILKSVVRTLEH